MDLYKLPVDILKLIFSYCDDFFDNILRENNKILIDHFTHLGLYKVIIISRKEHNRYCNVCPRYICDACSKLFIIKYIFDYKTADEKHKIIKIIPLFVFI